MDDFDALISSIEVDPHLEEREELLARAAALRAQADALEAKAENLGKTEEERDCKITPEHFEKCEDGAKFLAPDSERAKMRMMIPGMRAFAHEVGIMRREFDPEKIDEEFLESLPEEIRESVVEGLVSGLEDAFSVAPGVATIDVVEQTLAKEILSLEEVRAWRTLFGGMLQTSQGVINAIRGMAELDEEMSEEDIEEELAGSMQNIKELTALVERLDSILK